MLSNTNKNIQRQQELKAKQQRERGFAARSRQVLEETYVGSMAQHIKEAYPNFAGSISDLEDIIQRLRTEIVLL